MTASKPFKLIGPDGEPYDSPTKAPLGGYYDHYHGDYYNHDNTNKYGRLDCPAALSALKKSDHPPYKDHRRFFKSEDDAIAAGFRPCGTCLTKKFNAWKAGKDPRTVDFPDEYKEMTAKIEQENRQILAEQQQAEQQQKQREQQQPQEQS